MEERVRTTGDSIWAIANKNLLQNKFFIRACTGLTLTRARNMFIPRSLP
jgi:hypothetical protein